MSLRHVILTALLERPSTGLELTRRFDRSIGYFWSATHQQVYRELSRLEQDGLVASTPRPGLRGSPRSYDVLATGRAELRAWTGSEGAPRDLRDPLMVRLRAAAVVGTDAVLPELERHLVLHRARLAEFRAIGERDFGAPDQTESQHLQHLVLRAGIGLEEHWVGWLEQACAELDRADPADLAGHEPG